jgi:hypothetical protein
MKAFLIAYQKQLEIAFLLALLVAMDFAKIQDAELKYVLMGLIGTLTGFRGGAAAFRGLTSLMGNGSATATLGEFVPPVSAISPAAPATPVQPPQQ